MATKGPGAKELGKRAGTGRSNRAVSNQKGAWAKFLKKPVLTKGILLSKGNLAQAKFPKKAVLTTGILPFLGDTPLFGGFGPGPWWQIPPKR